MVVRIRFRTGPQVRRKGTKNQRVALAFASLLVPAVLVAWVLAVWRLGSDLRLFEDFAISKGLFSHWQVWVAIAASLNMLVVALNRYGKRPILASNPEEASTPLTSPVPESQSSLFR